MGVEDATFNGKCAKCRGTLTVHIQFKEESISYVEVEPCKVCQGIVFGTRDVDEAWACLNQLIGYFQAEENPGMLRFLMKHAARFDRSPGVGVI